MQRAVLFLWMVLGSLFLMNCGGEKQKNDSVKQKKVTKDHPGALTYKKFCASCHQSDGNGVPGMYPPITGTEMVNGDKGELIEIILNGMSGEIEVKGEIYNNVMPAHNHLSDKQVADLLTYIRANFNNQSSAVTEEEVANVRKQL